VRWTGGQSCGAMAFVASDDVLHPALLPRAMRIAEESLDAKGSVKSVMFGEFVSVVEADGLADRLWKFAKLSSDGLSSADSFSIDRALNPGEASLSFVKNQQRLAAPGEQHEVGLPMARRPAAFDLGGTVGDRAALLDDDRGASSTPPSCPFAARQQAMPTILLGGTMIDETID
jgi:hypothetical protein